MISIIIPTLNEEKFLPKLLESLVNQTNRDFEVIVVDGASRDKTVALAKHFSRKLTTLQVINAAKPGISLQRNLGARTARGDWLVFIDADSILLPYAVERIYWFIRFQKPRIFTTWFRPDTENIGDALVTLLINSVIEGALLLKRPVAQGPFAAVERSVFESVGGYDESLTWGEDYDMTHRIDLQGVHLSILRETLYIYSLRRVRHQGRLRVLQSYAKALVSVLVTKRTPRHMPGYIMGGHLYGKRKKSITSGVLAQFNKQAKALWKELIEL